MNVLGFSPTTLVESKVVPRLSIRVRVSSVKSFAY